MVKVADTTDGPHSYQWSAERFSYHLSAIHLGINTMDIVQYTAPPESRAFLNPRYDLLGYCDAAKLSFRPNPNDVALMLWDKTEEDQFWCHVSKKDWDKWMRRIIAGPGR